MFYSEALLSKTGPLARVWLAANLERKMGKKDFLTVNLENSIEAIVDQGSAPMALRLSGQLLLGVVRIYSKKAKYLLDDCNEALLKIKMAFRPGNVDLPADQSHTVTSAMLTLPDALTELDLLAPMPDPLQLLGELELGRGTQDPTMLDWGTQSLIADSIDRSDRPERQLMLEDEPLDLDLGDNTLPSIELGRRGRPSEALRDGPDDSMKLYDDELPLDLGDDPVPGPAETRLADIEMEDIPLLPEDEVVAPVETPGRRRNRDALSPLSEIRPSAERELETTFRMDSELHDESIHEAAQQRQKRRKLLAEDRETELHSADIRAQQNDRSKILKPMSFLPRDPMLLALMNMQKNGSFVSDILGNGRLAGWAPELRDVLSVEVIRRSGELKRKRDSGVSDMYLSDEAAAGEKQAIPELEIPQDDELDLPGAGIQSDGVRPPVDDYEELPMDEAPVDTFDDTTMPILHPADSGPISVGTRHAVHLLRERFSGMGVTESSTPSKRSNSSVLFQELLPEKRTTRADATKMFFEVLVLATKDAIKVEQEGATEHELGGPIRMRAKRGLWGAWAEQKAGGEIATQTEQETGATVEAEA
jgi:cohesin complex subunit SCC1